MHYVGNNILVNTGGSYGAMSYTDVQGENGSLTNRYGYNVAGYRKGSTTRTKQKGVKYIIKVL